MEFITIDYIPEFIAVLFRNNVCDYICYKHSKRSLNRMVQNYINQLYTCKYKDFAVFVTYPYCHI